RFEGLTAQCLAPLDAEGIARERITVDRRADLRYTGQNYELEVPFDPDPLVLRAAFERRHQTLYGYATGEGVECVNLRVSARVARLGSGLPRVEPTGAGGPRGRQRAHFSGTGEVALAVYDRAALRPGASIAGPATIEDEWSTTIVYPGQRCASDPFGNLMIEA